MEGCWHSSVPLARSLSEGLRAVFCIHASSSVPESRTLQRIILAPGGVADCICSQLPGDAGAAASRPPVSQAQRAPQERRCDCIQKAQVQVPVVSLFIGVNLKEIT